MKNTYLALSVGLTLPEANVPDSLKGFFFFFFSEGWDVSARTEISLINCWPIPKWNFFFMIILGQWILWPFKDKIKHTRLLPPPTPRKDCPNNFKIQMHSSKSPSRINHLIWIQLHGGKQRHSHSLHFRTVTLQKAFCLEQTQPHVESPSARSDTTSEPSDHNQTLKMLESNLT